MKSWLSRKALGVVSLLAALALTAQAEWSLALAVGWAVWVAWAAPVALDSYVIASFRAGKDRAWALGLMSAAVFSAHAAPVAFPGGFPWWLAGLCSIVPPIVAWRIHELGRLIATPLEQGGGLAVTHDSRSSGLDSSATVRVDGSPAGSDAKPIGSTRSDRPRSKPRTKRATGSDRIEVARRELLDRIEHRELAQAPSANAIRIALKVSPETARLLRDERKAAVKDQTITDDEKEAEAVGG